jgi:uncharacterized membrane protein
VSGSASHYPRWWFVLGLWRTIPVVVALVVGSAIGRPALGALLGLAFLASGFGFSRWVAKSEARQSDERLLRAFAVYFAAMGALLVLVLAAWLVVELA